ncbi:MAG: hypothetical protein HYT82_02890 [Candidatus Harrisonbacteria bacterium]|nr:hypothetical protein [Candidatus Harrisonbacteria bacterium]
MKVFFLLTDHLTMDIEAARREIREVRDGEAEICVIATGANEDSVAAVLTDCVCASHVYVVDKEKSCTHECDLEDHSFVFMWRILLSPILEFGDRIFARNASREERELIEAFIGNGKVSDMRITV